MKRDLDPEQRQKEHLRQKRDSKPTTILMMLSSIDIRRDCFMASPHRQPNVTTDAL